MRRDRLVSARQALGKTQEQIAHEMEVDRTTIGAWERGESTPRPNQRPAYAAALGVTLTEIAAMLSSMPVSDNEPPTPLKIALAVEQAASEIRSHVLSVVNGLLQTPGYAAAIARAVGTSGTTDDYVERNIAQRAYRQRRLLDGHVEVTVVQPEAALRSRLGDAETMAGQCRHLVELSAMRTVTIQVVPFDVGQYEAQRIGTFGLNLLPFSTSPIVDLHGYGGVRLIDDPDEVAYFQDAFEHATRVALTPKASTRFLEHMTREWEATA